MIGKSPNQKQGNLFAPLLKDFIDPTHELVILTEKINWNDLEENFKDLYSNTGQPGKPVRLMAGLLILKQLYDYGDETVVEAWIQNPYFQYFCGEAIFQWKNPCDPSDLVHFRKRITEEGAKKILQLSVSLHQGKVDQCSTITVDTTVQEKNITYPTDTKLRRKIIEKCNKIAKKEKIKLRQSYVRVTKDLINTIRFCRSEKQRKMANRAARKLRTIARRLTSDLSKKLYGAGLHDPYYDEIELFWRILYQDRHDTNKLYSIHEPQVACIAKGKAHKPYEFGSKVGIATTQGSNVVIGVKSFLGNPNDSKILKDILGSVKEITQKEFSAASVDRGFRGRKKIDNTEIIIPDNKSKKTISQAMRRKMRKRCAIEPIIGHVKHDFRMVRNYLKGVAGDTFNAVMACAAFNFRSALREIKASFLFIIFGGEKIAEQQKYFYFLKMSS
jgi:IS5 family transposase